MAKQHRQIKEIRQSSDKNGGRQRIHYTDGTVERK